MQVPNKNLFKYILRALPFTPPIYKYNVFKKKIKYLMQLIYGQQIHEKKIMKIII